MVEANLVSKSIVLEILMKYFLPTSIIMALMSGVAYAKPNGSNQKGPTCMNRAVLTDGVVLTVDQKTLLEDLKSLRQELRKDRKKNRGEMQQLRQEVFSGYVSGDLRRRDVEQQLRTHHEEKRSQLSRRDTAVTSLVDSYTSEQKAIVLENLEESRVCKEENYDRSEDFQLEKIEKIEDRSERKQQKLYGNLNLTSKQQRILDTHTEAHISMVHDRITERVSSTGSDLEELLMGDITSQELFYVKEDRANDHQEEMMKQADLMMDFVDSLREQQKEQLLDNLDDNVSRKRNEHRPRR
jgi:hypothetical protein